MSSALPPPVLIATSDALASFVERLAAVDTVAVDTESNSLHAYRERVCLLQFSTATGDYIIDPIALPDLSSLAPVFADPSKEKILHAAENDLLCLSRSFGFTFANVFDTMTAARALGWTQVGLASILEAQFGVVLDKKHQRADWGHRPLPAEMLDYARLDTHYLPALRQRQYEALVEAGYWEEALDEFDRLARTRAGRNAPDPMAFWRVKGATDLPASRH
jgi:ribonuclease D